MKKKFYQSKWFMGLVGLVIIGGGASFFLGGSESEWVTEEVQRGPIAQEVSVTGAVESNTTVDLRFVASGNVLQIPVSAGEEVVAGQKLMSLDLDKLEADVASASAGVQIEQAELDLMLAGPSDEEIALSVAKVREAEINLANASTEYDNVLLTNEESIRQAELEVEKKQDTYDTALASQENTADQIESDLAAAYEDSQPSAQSALDVVLEALGDVDQLLGIDDEALDSAFEQEIMDSPLSLRMNLETAYYQVQDQWAELEAESVALQDSWEGEEAEELLDEIESTLEYAKDMVDWAVEVLENMDNVSSGVQTNIDSLTDTLQTVQSTISTRLDALQDDIQAITNAKLGNTSSGLSADSEVTTAYKDLEIAESQLETARVTAEVNESEAMMNIDLMGARLEQAEAQHEDLIAVLRDVDLAAQRARLYQAQARYAGAVADLDDAVIYAPADGLVAKVHVDPGQSITGNDVAVSFITDDLQVKANVSETEIAFVSLGDTVSMTLDAFDLDDVFTGKVVAIDPAETVIQGVVYYEATVLFDESYENVRPGMTVNLDILTDENEDAIFVSSQAIQFEDKTTFVYVVDGEERERREVKTGIQSDRYVEILSGLEEGEDILLYEK